MKNSKTSVNLNIQQELDLKEMIDELKKSGNNISKSQLIAEAVSIMTSFYKTKLYRTSKNKNIIKNKIQPNLVDLGCTGVNNC